MALPAGFELEQAPAAQPALKLPPGFQLETEMPSEVPGPRKGGFLTGLGRSAASLADVTIGGILPAVAQQVAYPLARLGRSPEEAQAATQRLVSAIDQPVGKAFGVTNTPEYQQETGRQILDFIGQNVQKGAKWIASQTGLPVADVENMMGSAALAAPKAAVPLAKAAAPTVEKVVAGTKLALDKPLQARRERLSAQDYARGPQIDATKEAQRLGIALNPVDVQPNSVGARFSSGVAGARGEVSIARANAPKVNEIARRDMGLPEGAPLDKTTTFDSARAAVAEPYRQIEQIPVIEGNEATRAALQKLRPDETLIGGEASAKSINKLIDSAIENVDAGMSGKAFLDNIRNLRSAAKRIYNNPNASPKQVALADSNLAIANTLENMIETNIRDPKLVQDFRAARQQMARIYAYEGATDLNTGMVNPAKLARITASDNALTGDIASLGKIAGNFPSAFNVNAELPFFSVPRLSRTGIGGAAGALAGSMLGGVEGGLVGTAIGAATGEIGSGLMARRIASPGYQQGLSIRDARIPMNQLGTATAQQAQQNALTVVPPEVLDPSGQAAPRLRIVDYDANGNPIYAPMRGDRAPGTPNFTMPTQPDFGAAPTPFAQRALPNEIPRQTYEAQKRAELAQEFRARDERKPTSGEVILDFDPVTGRFRTGSQGLPGATPDTFSNFGAALETAASKVTAGQRFSLSAAEKVAWDRTRVDLADVAPGFKALSDKAIAEKMLDRAWVEQTATKAREKAAAFEQMAARAADERARQTAIANRERMMDLAEQMESSLRTPRPNVSGKQQGPKTRAAKRNPLADPSIKTNPLAE